MMGIPASKKRLNVTEMHIYRFSDGKVVELWGKWDKFGMMQQIGAIPPPPITTTTAATGYG
jgi:predicted ester cyclase